jgi:hypothetical protein
MRFDGIYRMTVLGKARDVMRFDFGGFGMGAPVDTVMVYGAILARGVGVLEEHYDDGDFCQLQGCVIAGVQYGTIVDVNPNQKSSPREFILAQNFPNPFNAATTIEYELMRSGYASLRVFDLLGKEVAVLFDKWMPTGRYRTTFEPMRMGSGFYIYRLIAGGQVLSKKMICLK